MVIEEVPTPGTAISKRDDGTEIESQIELAVTPEKTTITIRNSDGSELTVVHQPTLIETQYAVYRGTSIAISGAGYRGDTDLHVWLNSSPTYLGATRTLANGTFSFDVVVPGDFELGQHVLQVEGMVPSDVVQSTFLGLLVLDRPGGMLPATGSDPLISIALLAIALGAAVLLGNLRRRGGHPTAR